MNQVKIDKKYLRPQTFWDVDLDALEVQNDKEFIISRVVQKGSDFEVMYINSLFGFEEIYRVLDGYKGISNKVLGYYKTMMNASSR